MAGGEFGLKPLRDAARGHRRRRLEENLEVEPEVPMPNIVQGKEDLVFQAGQGCDCPASCHTRLDGEDVGQPLGMTRLV